MSDEIRAEEIRKGDLIRIEFKDDASTRWCAIERRAQETGVLELFNPDRVERLVLLDRPAPPLPTRPYSLVVPPAKSRSELAAYVLEPMPGGVMWRRNGTGIDTDQVENRVASGWVAIEGPEVIDK